MPPCPNQVSHNISDYSYGPTREASTTPEIHKTIPHQISDNHQPIISQYISPSTGRDANLVERGTSDEVDAEAVEDRIQEQRGGLLALRTNVQSKGTGSAGASESVMAQPFHPAYPMPHATNFPSSSFSSTQRASIFRPNAQCVSQVTENPFKSLRLPQPRKNTGNRPAEDLVIPKEEHRSPVSTHQLALEDEKHSENSMGIAKPAWHPERHIQPFDPFHARKPYVIPKEEPEDFFPYTLSPPLSPSPSPTATYTEEKFPNQGKRIPNDYSYLSIPNRSVPSPSVRTQVHARTKRANLEENESIWSTLPTKKKPKISTSSKSSERVRNGGIVTTSRFTLPIASTSSGVLSKTKETNGRKSEALRKATSYRPPPKKQVDVTNQGDDNEGLASPTNALGWKVVMIHP